MAAILFVCHFYCLPTLFFVLLIYKKDLELLLGLLAKIKCKEDLQYLTKSIKAIQFFCCC